MDYFFLSEADQEASANPVLVMLEESTGERYARAVGRKGVIDWLIKYLSDELKSWGHPGGEAGHFILKSDGEPAIIAVCDALARFHGGRVVPERPPVGEHQSNGAIEEAGKTTREYARVLKIQLEEKAKIKIQPSVSIVLWLIRWAAMLVSRYVVGKDGRPPYERKRGRKCRTPACKFGEQVLYRE